MRTLFASGWQLATELASAEGTWTEGSWRQHMRVMLSWRAEDAVRDADLVMAVVIELGRD